MRKTALKSVLELARRDSRVCFVGSDLGWGVMDDFMAEFPARIFREGIAEQHVIGLSSGLALDGKVVYVNTIASFLTRRCLEQIILDLCLSKAKVRLLGSGGGLVYAPLGPTHLATDDLALLRPLPGMTILAPCDAREMAALMPQTLNIDGPVYIRLAKGGDEIVSPPDTPPVIGRAVRLLKTEGRLSVLFITTGITAQIALAASRALPGPVEVLHHHTVDPLDAEAVLELAARADTVFTVEEHLRTGGLGSAVAEILAEADLASAPRFRRLALPDKFFSGHGSQNDLLTEAGLTATDLIRHAQEA